MKKNQKLVIKFTKSISKIPQKEWDSIFPQTAKSYNFFKTIDESLYRQFQPYYITIYEGNDIVCAAPCFTMNYPLDTTIEGPLKKIASWLSLRFPNIFRLRVMMCGSETCEGKLGIIDHSREDIINKLIRKMTLIAKRKHFHIIAFKDFSEEYTKLFETLLRGGFYKMLSYPSVKLDINFGSFEEYMSGLSKATRKNLKRKFKDLENKSKIKMEIKNNIDDILDEAYTLYLNTLNKSEVQFEILTKEFFRKISENMPDETKYFIWRIDGKLVAFNLCLVSNNVLIDEYIGFDYDDAYKYHLYYVTFRDIIIWCIENNIIRYESGALDYDPKKRLNFKFIPQYVYVRHINPLINLVIGFLCLILKPENFDPLLKFMKDKKNEK